MIDDNPTRYGYTDFNTAIAGTMVHELGHGLCLSDSPQAYSFQASACIYNAIDDFDTSLTYDSVMNYSLQMFQTHLSDGDNGIGDYNDWNAIDSEGIDDFAQWTMNEIGFEPGVMHPGITMEQAEKAKKRGTLGKVRRGDEVYDYREQKIYNTTTRETRSLK